MERPFNEAKRQNKQVKRTAEDDRIPEEGFIVLPCDEWLNQHPPTEEELEAQRKHAERTKDIGKRMLRRNDM